MQLYFHLIWILDYLHFVSNFVVDFKPQTPVYYILNHFNHISLISSIITSSFVIFHIFHKIVQGNELIISLYIRQLYTIYQTIWFPLVANLISFRRRICFYAPLGSMKKQNSFSNCLDKKVFQRKQGTIWENTEWMEETWNGAWKQIMYSID